MGTAKTATGGERLPVVSVARLEAATTLLERLLDENTDLFIAKAQAYRERARAGTSRGLTPQEAAGVAAGLAADLSAEERVALAESVQDSKLRAVSEPQPMEVLIAAGLSTPKAFLQAAARFVVLIEMPTDQFDEADEAGTIAEAIEPAAFAFRRAPISEARARAEAAFQHLAEEASVEVGEPLRLLIRTVWQALQQTADQMAPVLGSGLSSLTGSLEPTDGPSETSSTEPPTAAP